MTKLRQDARMDNEVKWFLYYSDFTKMDGVPTVCHYDIILPFNKATGIHVIEKTDRVLGVAVLPFGGLN